MMKKYLLLAFLAVIPLCLCKTARCQSVNYLSGDANSISARVVGIGERATETQDNAELQIIKVLLFRGLPDSQQKTPLVSTAENEAMTAHKDYFESLLNQKRYKSFIVSAIAATDAQKVKKKHYQQTFDVTVNLKALRSDLEHQGVIRKFGL